MAAGACVSAIVGGALACTAAATLPAILLDAGAGATVYGTGVGLKWGFKKVKNLIRR